MAFGVLVGPEKLTGADDPRNALQEKGGLADLWYMDDGDTVCHPILVPSHLHEFDVASVRVGAERNPQKTDVICCVNDLDAAPPEWKIDDVKQMAAVSTITAASVTLGVVAGPWQLIVTHLMTETESHSQDVCSKRRPR